MGQTSEKTITIAVIDESSFALITVKTNRIDRPLNEMRNLLATPTPCPNHPSKATQNLNHNEVQI
jgi:hypothetical protein